jgi:hypothetical protein
MSAIDMSFAEAIAWIATRDRRFAESCAEATGVSLAVSMAVWRHKGNRPIRSIKQAKNGLLAKCRNGIIVASGVRGDFERPTGSRRTRITNVEWGDLRAAEKRSTGEMYLAPKCGSEFWHGILFSRDQVRSEFSVRSAWDKSKAETEAKAKTEAKPEPNAEPKAEAKEQPKEAPKAEPVARAPDGKSISDFPAPSPNPKSSVKERWNIHDEPHFKNMKLLLSRGEASSIPEAARKTVKQGVVGGAGIPDSKAKRLERGYRKWSAGN